MSTQTMPHVQVKQKYQVTIPYDIRQRVNIHEGDMLEVKEFQGMIVFIPKIIVYKDKALDDEQEQVKRLQDAYALLAKKRSAPPKTKEKLFELMDDAQTQTEHNGFTQEILDQIIHEK